MISTYRYKTLDLDRLRNPLTEEELAFVAEEHLLLTKEFFLASFKTYYFQAVMAFLLTHFPCPMGQREAK